MLLILPFWIWIFLVTVSFGQLLIQLGSRIIKSIKPDAIGVEVYSLTGICFLAWLLALISFFYNIGLQVQVGISILALLNLVLQWQTFKDIFFPPIKSLHFPVLARSLLVLFSLLILIQAAMPPVFPDSGLYHAQFIKWLHTYPVVPGLGNLHSRLAFNSHVHLLSAFFSPEVKSLTAFQQTLGSYLFLIFTSYQINRFTYYLKQKEVLALYYIGTLLFVFMALRLWISSPMPDNSITLLLLFILGIFLDYRQSPNVSKTTDGEIISGANIILIVLFLTAITIKLSAVFIGLLIVYSFLLLAPPARIAYVKMVAALTVLVLTPWLIRGVLLSGYVFFPLPVPDIFQVDWAIPSAQVRVVQDEIYLFARWPNDDWIYAAGKPFRDWFPFWFSQQNRFDIVLLALLGILIVLHFFLYFIHRPVKKYNLLPVFLVLVVCTGLWFLSAPAFRFGHGYLIGAVMVGALNLLPGINPKFLFLLPIFAFLYGVQGISRELYTFKTDQWLVPADYQVVELVQKQVGNTKIWLAPGDGKCWDGPIPCTLEIEPDLELRGKSLVDGFRIKEQTRPKR